MNAEEITGVQLIAGGLTDRGMVREENEDNFSVDVELGLFIVSDGVGGEQAGKKASELTVRILPEQIRQTFSTIQGLKSDELQIMLRTSICSLSSSLFQIAQSHDELRGMGATLVLCLVRDARAFIAHMGDSRAYLMRHGVMWRLTEDHSIVSSMIKHGSITRGQAKNHPLRHVITRHVGMEDTMEPDTAVIPLENGDRILLCSDGLTDMLSEREIATRLWEGSEPGRLCEMLIQRAKECGGVDNVTAVVFQYGERDEDEHLRMPKVKVRRDCFKA